MPITSILDLVLKPEAAEKALDELRTTLVDTRAFPGCLGVDVLVDTQDPAHVVLYETWESEERDDAYRSWRAEGGNTRFGDFLAGPPTLSKFTLAADV
jgi:heme oxygenase (mycobilin-producing)